MHMKWCHILNWIGKSLNSKVIKYYKIAILTIEYIVPIIVSICPRVVQLVHRQKLGSTQG